MKLIPKHQNGSNLFRTNKTAYVDSVLTANKNLDWVKRLREANTPTLKTNTLKGFEGEPDSEASTHLMSDDGKGYVFPQIVRDSTLRFLGGEDPAYDYAKQTNTGIQLPQEQGTWFANNGYKIGTNVLKKLVVPKHQTGSVLVNRALVKARSPEEIEKVKFRLANERAKNISGKLEEPPINVEDFATLGGGLLAKGLGKFLGKKLISKELLNIIEKTPLKQEARTGPTIFKDVWHSSEKPIEKFNSTNPGGYFAQHGGTDKAIFFADRAPESQSFLSKRPFQKKYDVQMNRPHVVDFKTPGEGGTSRWAEEINKAEKEGYDGTVVKGIRDNQMDNSTIYASFDPNKIRSSGFKSEIDWGKFNKEIPNNPKLMEEYNTIEKNAKVSGKWMKNPDGSQFKGSPEQFIQQQSGNFKQWFSGANKVMDESGSAKSMYHGSPNKNVKEFHTQEHPSYIKNENTTTGDAGIYFTDKKEYADQYQNFGGKKGMGKTYETYLSPHTAITIGETERDRVRGIPFSYLWNHGKVNIDAVKAGKELMREYPDAGLEIAMHNPTQIKSAIGNNGMFSKLDPNIYKGVIPGALIVKHLKSKEN